MLKCFKDLDIKHGGFFAAGILFGTAGIKVLSGRDARNFYTKATAAVLRAKDCVMNTATTIQENAEDIYEEAKAINEDRYAEEVYNDFDGLMDDVEEAADDAVTAE